MQLHEQIHIKRCAYATSKPRSTRRIEVHRDLVKLVAKQLRKEIRREKTR